LRGRAGAAGFRTTLHRLAGHGLSWALLRLLIIHRLRRTLLVVHWLAAALGLLLIIHRLAGPLRLLLRLRRVVYRS
jgi:hypothetical protein